MNIVEIKKEMGFTHHEFFKKLPKVLGETPYDYSDDTVSFEHNGKTIQIELGAEQVRELSKTTRLPFTRIVIRFFGHQAAEVEQFVRHFNLRYIKGGG